MDIWNKIKSTLGLADDNGIDANGVNHNNMSIRDELEYQLKQAKAKEDKSFLNKFADNYKNVVRKFGADKLISDLYNLGYDGVERFASNNKDVENFTNRSSVGMAQAEAKRLTPMNISDEQKHRYVSCIGSFDGPISASITGAAGLYKEGADLIRKWNNSRYGSNKDIFIDSMKDLKNDAIGVVKGLTSKQITECDDVIPFHSRRKR